MNKILYSRKKCIGCGICSSEASHIWGISSVDGKADLLDAEFKNNNYFRALWEDEKPIMEKITEYCPVKAIQII